MTTRFAQLNQTPPAPEKESPDRSIAIGLGCTVLFHLLLVWLSPRFAFDKFSGVHSGITVTSANKGKSFDFELAQPPTTAKERDPFRFVETNSALSFDRAAATGMRLDIPAGTAVRFEPGETKRVQLVAARRRRDPDAPPSRAMDAGGDSR